MTTLHHLREDFLHYLWRLKKLDLQDLRTTAGEVLEIRATGEYHRDAGPDFMNARVLINDTLWAGHIEMHLRSSDWYRHRHQEDPAYGNVILHVVYEEDTPVFRSNGERIPCLALRDRIPAQLYQRYRSLMHQSAWIPCQPLFHTIPDGLAALWLTRLAIERLEDKTTAISASLTALNNDWEETLYRYIAYGFGVRVNSDSFLQLASVTPLRLIQKCTSLFQKEALLFGQAGFLSDDTLSDDAYALDLSREYRYLQSKFDLVPLQKSVWKFLRMRPAGFPTIRIAQLAAFLHAHQHFFQKILRVETPADLISFFQIQPSEYWNTHYTFGHISPAKVKMPGKSAVELLTINAIAPLVFLYGVYKGDDDIREHALRLLEATAAEKNIITEKWREMGLKSTHAAHSQAMIQLKNKYCDQKRCLECALGNAILNK